MKGEQTESEKEKEKIRNTCVALLIPFICLAEKKVAWFHRSIYMYTILTFAAHSHITLYCRVAATHFLSHRHTHTHARPLELSRLCAELPKISKLWIGGGNCGNIIFVHIQHTTSARVSDTIVFNCSSVLLNVRTAGWLLVCQLCKLAKASDSVFSVVCCCVVCVIFFSLIAVLVRYFFLILLMPKRMRKMLRVLLARDSRDMGVLLKWNSITIIFHYI